MNPGLATHTINSKFADSGQAACDAMSLGCQSVYFFPQHQFNKQYEIDIYVSLVPNFIPRNVHQIVSRPRQTKAQNFDQYTKTKPYVQYLHLHNFCSTNIRSLCEWHPSLHALDR